MRHLFTTALSAVFAASLVATSALPSYAATAIEDPIVYAMRTQPQTLTASAEGDFAQPDIQIDATAKPVAPVARAAQSVSIDLGADLPIGHAPASSQGNALVQAALGQLGVFQDCTDAVQNALATLGLIARRDSGGPDLGVFSFASFGTRVSAADIQPGDIMMSAGHVAIYTGDGVTHTAVHGGWRNGGTTPATTVLRGGSWSDPNNYSVIVRLP